MPKMLRVSFSINGSVDVDVDGSVTPMEKSKEIENLISCIKHKIEDSLGIKDISFSTWIWDPIVSGEDDEYYG